MNEGWASVLTAKRPKVYTVYHGGLVFNMGRETTHWLPWDQWSAAPAYVTAWSQIEILIIIQKSTIHCKKPVILTSNLILLRVQTVIELAIRGRYKC